MKSFVSSKILSAVFFFFIIIIPFKCLYFSFVMAWLFLDNCFSNKISQLKPNISLIKKSYFRTPA